MRARAIGGTTVTLFLAALALGPRTWADKYDENCICRDLELTCEIRPTRTPLVGQPYEICTKVRNNGNYKLENIRVRQRLCEGSQVLEGGQLETVVPLLEVGETYTHCTKIVSYTTGDCRFVAHGVDDTEIAAAGCYCTATIQGLPALQLEMIDLDAQLQDKGVFRVGEEFVYRLLVEEDSGSMSVDQLRVEWTLPPALEFVSGKGDGGTTVTGSGQSCESSIFSLGVGDVRTLEVRCRVLSVPSGGLVQTRADVLSAVTGEVLAQETESSTLRN